MQLEVWLQKGFIWKSRFNIWHFSLYKQFEGLTEKEFYVVTLFPETRVVFFVILRITTLIFLPLCIFELSKQFSNCVL